MIGRAVSVKMFLLLVLPSLGCDVKELFSPPTYDKENARSAVAVSCSTVYYGQSSSMPTDRPIMEQPAVEASPAPEPEEDKRFSQWMEEHVEYCKPCKMHAEGEAFSVGGTAFFNALVQAVSGPITQDPKEPCNVKPIRVHSPEKPKPEEKEEEQPATEGPSQLESKEQESGSGNDGAATREPDNSNTLRGWFTEYHSAVKLAKQEEKDILLYFWSKDCAPCRALSEWLEREETKILAEDVIAIKVDADDFYNAEQTFDDVFKIPAVPLMAVYRYTGGKADRVGKPPTLLTPAEYKDFILFLEDLLNGKDE